MILKSSHFAGRIEKIAQAITSITSSSSSGSKNLFGSKNSITSGSYGNKSQNKRINLDSTLSKSRDKADLQPLHKNSRIVNDPSDKTTETKMNRKQTYLGNIEDKRITFNHLRR